MADLVKNTTRQAMNLPGGFTIQPGGKETVPSHVLAHPYTQVRLRTGRLEVVVEAKATKPKSKPKDEPEAEAE